ncbi:MAG TPA: hypothetical protein VK184_19820, partial [Nostocaceae cyanobacterium]|nr:hypothetical protein [Nostocaceae cyanobacterium]
ELGVSSKKLDVSSSELGLSSKKLDVSSSELGLSSKKLGLSCSDVEITVDNLLYSPHYRMFTENKVNKKYFAYFRQNQHPKKDIALPCPQKNRINFNHKALKNYFPSAPIPCSLLKRNSRGVHGAGNDSAHPRATANAFQHSN